MVDALEKLSCSTDGSLEGGDLEKMDSTEVGVVKS